MGELSLIYPHGIHPDILNPPLRRAVYYSKASLSPLNCNPLHVMGLCLFWWQCLLDPLFPLMVSMQYRSLKRAAFMHLFLPLVRHNMILAFVLSF